MNKKVFKLSIIDNKLPLFICFCFLAGTIISFYLSIIISTYFYLLAVPLLLITLYLIKLTIAAVKNKYKRLIKEEKYLKNGRHFMYYDVNKKQVKVEVNILNGKKQGVYRSYYENGHINQTCNYLEGEFDGLFKEYYENGSLKNEFNFKKGIKQGICKSYYENGHINQTCNYLEGEFDGLFKEYYENGSLKNEFNFKKGIKVKQFQSFYDNGIKYREGNLGEKELIKEYYKNGSLKFLKDNNKYTFYDVDNNLKCEIYDIKNENGFFGQWKNYRKDGTIQYELDFDHFNSDEKNNIVTKTIFTKQGNLYSKNTIKYRPIEGCTMLYSSEYAELRKKGGEIYHSYPCRIIGPPGIKNGFHINIKPISSIEDIIEFI